MNHHSPRYPDADRQASKSTLKGLCATLAITLLAAPLGACKDGSATTVQHNTFVRTDIVQPRARQRSVTLTGEVQARFRADLSFNAGDVQTAVALWRRYLQAETRPSRRGEIELQLAQVLAENTDDVGGAIAQLEHVVENNPYDLQLRDRRLGYDELQINLGFGYMF